MHSLYDSLLAQHSRQLTPVRCAEPTIAQLLRYFEDVVVENKLSALVVESFPYLADRPARDFARIREIGANARNSFFLLTANDPIGSLRSELKDSQCYFLKRPQASRSDGRFVVIADARFSALLASPPKAADEEETAASEVIWTFEPDVVYSGLEYLMARVTAEFSDFGDEFSTAVRGSMPKATSLQLTLTVTTKLARLLQAQAEREIAVNRIATAIRNSLKLDSILQTSAAEVGRALAVSSCGLRVDGELVGSRKTTSYIDPEIEDQDREHEALETSLEEMGSSMAETHKSYSIDGLSTCEPPVYPLAAVPLSHHGRIMGLLLVRSQDGTRQWAENELLLLHTVADQVTVAINQAHLFAQLQQQALTDGLTGCHNRRAFEMQLERDLHFATRMRQPLSLILMDLDNLKVINDHAGHEAGDLALRLLADCLRAELRAVDTPARYGGDEFAIILPQSAADGAMLVAERLRARIENVGIPGVEALSASFGVASFPAHASSRDSLVAVADQALYKAKNSGRNCACLPDEFEDESATEELDREPGTETLLLD